MHRYLLRQLAAPFAVALLLCFFLLSFAQLLKTADATTGFGLGLGDIWRVIAYSLPPMLAVIIPLAWLFAVQLAIGRMGEDRELLALASFGLSPTRLLWIPGLMGLLLTLLCTSLQVWAEPWGVRGLRQLLARGAQRALTEAVQAGTQVQWVGGVSFSARTREGDTLRGIIVADRRHPVRPTLVTAEEGRLQPATGVADVVFAMERGSVVVEDLERGSARQLHFDRARYRLDVAGLTLDKAKTLPALLGEDMDSLANLAWHGATRRLRRYAAVLWHRRLALPWAATILGLVAVTLAVGARRGARARGFLFSLLIAAAYYSCGRGAELWARGGQISPFLAAWLPNLLCVALLVCLLPRLRASRS